MRAKSKKVTNYWYAFYVRDGLCGLCGNHGVVDTTGTRSPAGVEVGGKFLCICPNGQILRKAGADPDRVSLLRGAFL